MSVAGDALTGNDRSRRWRTRVRLVKAGGDDGGLRDPGVVRCTDNANEVTESAPVVSYSQLTGDSG